MRTTFELGDISLVGLSYLELNLLNENILILLQLLAAINAICGKKGLMNGGEATAF